MTATNENGSFAGKVAFVTGAGSGMDRTTALAFTEPQIPTARPPALSRSGAVA
jgi:NAD(P)-dependent dehydrogenase (short-subunit alcohol dehydrogenase family)